MPNSSRKISKIAGNSLELSLPHATAKGLKKRRIGQSAGKQRRQQKAVIKELRKFETPPPSHYSWALTSRVQRAFGSWNKGLEIAFNKVNQHRYTLDIEGCFEVIRKYVKKFKKLPLRQDFDGICNTPYWEYIIVKTNSKNWREVLNKANITNIEYYSNKHGYGQLICYKKHIFLSTGEYLIGKYLIDNNIKFEQEVPYSLDSKMRFDFYIPNYALYIEYYGIATEDYKERIKLKQKLYDNRKVLEIYKYQNTVKKLSLELQRL